MWLFVGGNAYKRGVERDILWPGKDEDHDSEVRMGEGAGQGLVVDHSWRLRQGVTTLRCTLVQSDLLLHPLLRQGESLYQRAKFNSI